MTDGVLLASHLASILVGAGGSPAVIIAAARKRIGWLPAGTAVLLLASFALSYGAERWVIVSGENSVPSWVELVQGVVWFALFPVLAATFPDGRLVPRWSVWLVLFTCLVAAGDVLLGGALRELDAWPVYAGAQTAAGIVLVAVRYRVSATTSERESVRWVLLGLLLTVTAFMLILIATGTVGGPGPLAAGAANAALLPLMLGLVIGLARPGVWNVDTVFRVVLFVLIAGWALLGVHAVAALVGPGAAAVALAVASPPIAWLGWRGATWVVYRDRLGPDAAVRRLAAALDADSPQPVAARVVAVTREVTGSPAASLVAADPSDEEVFDAGAVPPSGTETLMETFTVSFREEMLATLHVAPRLGESALSVRDRATTAAIARHAAPALHGARALFEATAAQAALITAREEERRRLRRDLHDDLGPSLSGLALSAAALARNAAGLAPALAAGAGELQADIQAVVEQTREISHGLRPPILDDQGLVAAIRTRVVARLSPELDVRLETDGALGDLPAAVSLAVLRIVQEATENVRRHARARLCRISLALTDEGVRVEVSDDGIGVDPAVVPGMGLRSIRERASELGGRSRIAHREQTGTTVTAWLPVATAHGLGEAS